MGKVKDKRENVSIFESTVWKLVEKCGVQGASFVLQIILARILLPSDFGKYTIILTFVAIGSILVECGFGTALIQKKELTNEDISSVFWISMALATFVSVILFLAAPVIETFYQMDGITMPLRMMIGAVFIGGFNSIQLALATRNLQFRALFAINFTAAIISAILGIYLAVLGKGLFALVAQYLSNITISTALLSMKIKWRPTFTFSKKNALGCLAFSWKLLVASIFDRMYAEIYNLIIGKFYSAADLGIYSRGRFIPSAISQVLSSTVSSVMFPFFSTKQDDIGALKSTMRRVIRKVSFVVFPLMLGLAATAELLVVILLTDKWTEAIPLFRITAIGFIFAPISSIMLMAMNSIGRSDLFLKLEIARRIIGLIILMVTVKYGLVYITAGISIAAFIGILLNVYPCFKLFNYSFKEQIQDLLPSMICSIIMFICVFEFGRWCQLGEYSSLLFEIIIGIVSYLFFSYLLNKSELTELVNRALRRRK